MLFEGSERCMSASVTTSPFQNENRNFTERGAYVYLVYKFDTYGPKTGPLTDWEFAVRSTYATEIFLTYLRGGLKRD